MLRKRSSEVDRKKEHYQKPKRAITSLSPGTSNRYRDRSRQSSHWIWPVCKWQTEISRGYPQPKFITFCGPISARFCRDSGVFFRSCRMGLRAIAVPPGKRIELNRIAPSGYPLRTPNVRISRQSRTQAAILRATYQRSLTSLQLSRC